MRALHEQFPDQLVVIGVHSAKFPSEQLTANIREAAARLGIEHPVVNDAGFQIWRAYGVTAWPTVVLIDPQGNYVGSQAGEIEAQDFAALIRQMLDDFGKEGLIDSRPRSLAPYDETEKPGQVEVEALPEGPATVRRSRYLSYPSKVLHTADGRLFVADTGHHRLLELRLSGSGLRAEVLRAFGTGTAGMADGPAAEAAFHHPHGLALAGSTLYVADTGNHAVRAVDLPSGEVRTLAGTGELARTRERGSDTPTAVDLRSPWAVLARGNVLYIAMAGSHQIWTLAGERELKVFAGSGREALEDGPAASASFNQPSDLAASERMLYVADAEASAVRAITLDGGPEGRPYVTTVVGQGLFEFGDVDGIGPEVRLQHAQGLAYAGGELYVADSYNHKIKRLDPETRRVQTLVGSGQPGYADGPLEEAQLYEPEGLSAATDRDGRAIALYIADTNNHLIRVADLLTGMLHTLEILDTEWTPGAEVRVNAPGAPVRLSEVRVPAGDAAIVFDIELPAGYKFNAAMPTALEVLDTSGRVESFEAGEAPTIRLEVDRDRELSLNLTVYYCRTDEEDLCLIHDAELLLPLVVDPDGEPAAHVRYRVDERR